MLAPQPADGWTAATFRLGGDVVVAGAPDLRADASVTVAWVAVQDPPADDEPLEVDPDLIALAAAADRLLGRTARPWVGAAVEAALGGAGGEIDGRWAGAHVARLAHALVAGLHAGHLPAGGDWNVQVDDTAGVAAAALPPVLDLLGGLADGWDPTLAPTRVVTNLGAFARSGSGYRSVPGRLATVPDVWIRLEHDRTPADPLPVDLDAPAVVVRPAAGVRDPGPPPAPGMPHHAEPALVAAARWCFGDPEPNGEMLAEIAGLFDGTWPALPARPSALVGETWRLREVADLLLDAWPDEPAALCFRAQVEAMDVTGRRARVASLVEDAMRAARTIPSAVEPLRRLAFALRAIGHEDWLPDLWDAADRHDVLADAIEDDVLNDPARSSADELSLVLARRLERARFATASLRAGKDGAG